MIDQVTLKKLTDFSTQIRVQTIRQIGVRGFGHIGGSMSIVELLSVLYGMEMRYDPQNPSWDNRDWLICSKGHAGPAVYAALALKGFFPMDWMDTLNQPNTHLPSHCDRKKTPGIDMTTGSLGQGLSIACGIALGHSMDKKDNMTYCIIGDGESQEGQIWEAVLFAAQKRLDNLILFVDDNKAQLDDYTSNIENMQSYVEKFKSFNWDAAAVDGHDMSQIQCAIARAKGIKGVPSAIILNTVKGKGCTFAERQWNHHINVTAEEMDEAIRALQNQ